MKAITKFLLIASAFVLGSAVAQNLSDSSSCQSFNLTFDDTPGVAELEVRGLILTESFYAGNGIANVTCIRADRDPFQSVCRLFDTSEPVGRWNASCAAFGCRCDCAPHACTAANQCGDPDLASAVLENVLIIEERSRTRAPAFPPDDNAKGGSILIEFTAPTSVISIGFLDIEEPTPAMIEFRHANGATQIMGPITGDGGHNVTSILIDEVTSMTITMVGSGAISSLQYSQNCIARSGGDPHFGLFGSARRQSFHGECDLVLIKSPLFDLHVRTTISTYYSYIDSAALALGGRKFEISAANPDMVLLDEKVQPLDESDPLIISSVHENATYKYYKAAAQGSSSKSISYVLEITPWVFVRVKMHAEFLTVSVHGNDELQGAVGLLGRYPDGSMLDRAGNPFILTFKDYGFEWQVQPGVDGALFHDDRSPQLPYERCRMPTVSRPSRRKLRFTPTVELYPKALDACRQVAFSTEDVELCVDDVLTTGDVDLAAIW